MLQLIKKGVTAILAAIVFVATTLTGLVAGLIGAIIRAQLPEPVLDETDSPEATSDAAPAANIPRTSPALHPLDEVRF
jgi:hypothetical protein